ncbi:MAG: hypothetical protein ACOC4L_03200, partial [Halanaerobium sp.]
MNLKEKLLKIYHKIYLLISNYIKNSEITALIILAVLVGFIGGIGAVLFHHLISIIKHLFFGT